MKKGIKDASNPKIILAEELGKEAGTIGQLPDRIQRYEKAKIQSTSMSHYIRDNHPQQHKLYTKIHDCGGYLRFYYYPSINQVRLAQAYFCEKALLCRFCAIRRASKFIKRYKDRFDWLMDTNPDLKPYLVTTTVKDGADLKQTFNHLQKSTKKNHHKRHLKNNNAEVNKASAAVWSYEIKKGKNSGLWHPHSHAIWLCEEKPSQLKLSEEWHKITGDSFIVDVTPMDMSNPIKAFCEVFKYAIKFSDQSEEDTWHCYQTLRNKRLLGSFGDFYGIPAPDNLLDDPLEGLEYEIILYNFINGKYNRR
jgi:hypothetical protein